MLTPRTPESGADRAGGRHSRPRRIGFSPRPGACGGGGVVSLDAMKIMLSVGMELFLSEYPEFDGDPQTEK